VTKKHVAGRKAGKVMLYALSTCIWCKKTKRLLNELGVEYDYIDVDLSEGAEETAALEAVKKFNPSRSFPTLIIDDEKAVLGFNEKEIREALK
jgi:glutaredoxin-like protein NrdH